MFEFLFKYPIPVFSKGKFVLLGAWPVWVLLVLAAVCAIGLGLIIAGVAVLNMFSKMQAH